MTTSASSLDPSVVEPCDSQLPSLSPSSPKNPFAVRGVWVESEGNGQCGSQTQAIGEALVWSVRLQRLLTLRQVGVRTVFSSTGAESSPGVTAVSVKLSAHTVRGCARARMAGGARERISPRSATSPARCLLCLLATPRPGPQATVRRVQHAGAITHAAATRAMPPASNAFARSKTRVVGGSAQARGICSGVCTVSQVRCRRRPASAGSQRLSARLSAGSARRELDRGGGRGGMRGARVTH